MITEQMQKFKSDEQNRLEMKRKNQADMAEYWRKQHEQRIDLDIKDQMKFLPAEFAYNKKLLESLNILDDNELVS